ncbi:prepilin peptidase [Campylobacter peloridis]|uniref:prepilin peptidase n=1 Tax=Campylobacter peloridis TaxID=488546 RepID=UPI001C730ECD|nr:A24 family peptidase [Campylobacter peloridis]MBX1886386.1 prepilin peptidase [Campylobacter peloridis]MBX2079269.1 prepilin peptidase [Campylobacter peloridis]
MIFFIILGLCVGSFVNVVILRTIKNQSIVKPRSQCFKCGKTLKFYHLIPLISFIFLKGKCAFCNEKISFIYPFNELFCAFLFVYSFLSFENIFVALIFACMLAIFLILSWMDYYLKAVSEIWLWLLFILAIVFDFINGNWKIIHFEETFLFKACFGAGMIFLLKSLINFFKNFKKRDENLESLGEGDVIIIALIFGIFGYEKGFFILFVACFLSFLLFLKIAKKDYQMPMIPFLLCGILVNLSIESMI